MRTLQTATNSCAETYTSRNSQSSIPFSKKISFRTKRSCAGKYCSEYRGAMPLLVGVTRAPQRERDAKFGVELSCPSPVHLVNVDHLFGAARKHVA
jgi:hypothetical protein